MAGTRELLRQPVRLIPFCHSLKKRFAQEAQWYEIGWGDKGFYQSQEITTALTLQAMFWSSGAVMHIVAFSGKPERYFAGSEIMSLSLDTNQRSSLMRYLGRSFARDEEGNLIPLKQGIYGDSQFYAANGRYGILNTCNTWTAKGLESAGLTIHSSLKLTAGSVMKAVEDHRVCLNKYCYPW
ncbi:membrane protein [Salmonella bongori]|nr:membrane protein [Salmonella bongori]